MHGRVACMGSFEAGSGSVMAVHFWPVRPEPDTLQWLFGAYTCTVAVTCSLLLQIYVCEAQLYLLL